MKTHPILLFALSAILSSCASLQPETTANGEAARAECLALQRHRQEMEQRLAVTPSVKGADKHSDKRVTIQLIVIETTGKKSDPPVEQSRVLSALEMTEQMQAIKREGRIVTYPKLVTQSGKSVSFRNVVNQPFAKTSTTDPVEIDYVPIGTLIGVVPTLLSNNKVHLALDLTHSDRTGTERYHGNPYPTIASQKHAGTYQLAKGETVLIELPTTRGGTLQVFATAE